MLDNTVKQDIGVVFDNAFINETYPVYEHYKDIYNTFEIENNAGIKEIYDQVDQMMKEEI